MIYNELTNEQLHPKFKRVYATKGKQGTNAKTLYTRKLLPLNSTIGETWSPKIIQIGYKDNATKISRYNLSKKISRDKPNGNHLPNGAKYNENGK